MSEAGRLLTHWHKMRWMAAGGEGFWGIAVSLNESGRQGSTEMGCYWIAVLPLCFNEDQAAHCPWSLLVLECKETQQPLHEGQTSRKRGIIDG